MLPDCPLICLAHPVYRLMDAYERLEESRKPKGAVVFRETTRDGVAARIGEIDILVASLLWDNALLPRAGRLRLVQSVSAGINQFDLTAFETHGVHLASAQGANEQAVSEHALALILALARRLPEARDNQAKRFWRPYQGDHALREDVIGGKTLAIVGLGRIGGRVARLAKAFGMHVIGLRRNPSAGAEGADEVVAVKDLHACLARADYVVLTCPLTPETRDLLDARALAAMKPGAALVNMARGGCVVEADLVAALRSGRLGAAALDVTAEEPLPASSLLWEIPNVLITPHTASETRAYEANVIELLVENVARLRRGEKLVNQIV